jgi:hypothetical protein
MHFYNNRASTLGRRKEGRDVPPLPRMSFWISWDSSMPICPRQKVFFFFVIVIVVASALLCSSFAGLSLPPAPVFSFEWREFFFLFLFLLRPAAAECYIWDSIFFLSYVQLSRAAVAQRSGYYCYFIARRQTSLQMARSGCREARGHHLPARFGFLRPPACQLSCCQSPCP